MSASEPASTAEILWRREWWTHRPFLLELFVVSNFVFLILDVYLAHSFNDFAHWAEWIPVYFAVASSIALAVAVVQQGRDRTSQARWIGYVVGWTAIAVGLAGLVWHLEGWFFESVTLKSLVYSAPFVAPLAFAGLGCLLLLNRMEDPARPKWGQWVVFLAWGGFVGNFGLSVIDHARNAFFQWMEWIPVVVSALAVGTLLLFVVRSPTRRFFQFGYAVLGLQVATGLAGVVLHLVPLFETGIPESGLWDAIRYGPPLFAPLLFVDLSVLAALGLWDLHAKLVSPS